jgi:hypothetical protein
VNQYIERAAMCAELHAIIFGPVFKHTEFYKRSFDQAKSSIGLKNSKRASFAVEP